MVKSKKQRKRKLKKEGLYFIFALLLVFFGLIFIYKTTKKIYIIQELQEEKLAEINLSQYKEATFSDSFSGNGWIDTEKTTLTFKEEEMIFIYPQKENLMASLSEQSEIEERVRQIISLTVNFPVVEVKAAQITRSENEIINGQIKYYFSNDSGLTWEPAQIGQITYFKNPGNELKWKAEIGPLNQENLLPVGSFIDSIYLRYWYKR